MKYLVSVEERRTIDVYVIADSVEDAERKAALGEYELKEEVNIDTVDTTCVGDVK